ncbi:unnamed protein product, partial [marine sediment metagenome]
LDNEAAAETLAITKATYSSKKGQLKVEATSSLGLGADLEATYTVGTESARVPMEYSPRKGKWSITFTGLDTKPSKVTVYSSSGGSVDKFDIGGKSGKSIPVANAYAMQPANTTPEGIADSPVLLPWARRTPVSAGARQPADVSIPLTVADLPPLAVDSTTTGSQQLPPPELVNLMSGAFEDTPADDELVGESVLNLLAVPLDGELLDELVLLF